MSKDSGRKAVAYNKAMKCGNYIAGAGLAEETAVRMLLDASTRNGLVRDDGKRSVLASICSGIRNGRARPRAVELDPRDLAPSDEPAEWTQFWESRPALARMLEWARARRVGPWAMLGCVLARIVAASSIEVVLPALVGGSVSLNLFVALVDASGDGKGSAEQASVDAIDMPGVATFVPGSGEGVAHLFVHRNKAGELVRHRDAVILSAAEVDTLSALKTRQASTLLPELRKAWMGEPLGFAYVDPDKSLEVARHSYRLCMIVGVQPATAAPCSMTSELARRSGSCGCPPETLTHPTNGRKSRSVGSGHRRPRASPVAAEQAGCPTSAPWVWAHAPGKRDIAHGLPGDAGIKFHFPPGVAAYSELVGKPGLSAFVVIDVSSCRFLHVTFRHAPEPV